jgi:hypothetical protein
MGPGDTGERLNRHRWMTDARPQDDYGCATFGDAASCVREETPSLGKARYRCEPTVRGDRYSRSPI